MYNTKHLVGCDLHNFMHSIRNIEENFVMNMHATFKLNPLSFVTRPYLSCEAAINMTRI